MRYKLIIFDFDGTLADSYPFFMDAITEVIEQFGLRRVDSDDLEMLRSKSAREVIAYLGLPFWKVPSVGNLVRRRMAESLDSISLFEGIVGLLEQLTQAGVILSIVSSNSEENIRKILGPEHAKLINIYDCGATLFGKASKFRRVLKRSGISKSETICVGDEIRDIEAAHAEGLDFGAVSWGYTKVDGLEKLSPAFVFNRPDEIFETVTRNGKVSTSLT